jgi:hypothetical protein
VGIITNSYSKLFKTALSDLSDVNVESDENYEMKKKVLSIKWHKVQTSIASFGELPFVAKTLKNNESPCY